MQATTVSIPSVKVVLLCLLACLPIRGAGRTIAYGDPPRPPQPGEDWRGARRVALAHSGGAGFAINLSSREESRIAHNTLYAAGEYADSAWDGSVSNCMAGTTASTFKELTLLRVNYYRAMAGVPSTVVLDDTFNSKNQAAALIMAANDMLSHTPSAEWHCFTAAGQEAAGNSNLALGSSGPDAINGYIEDDGANNYPVGHRRWVLYPQTRLMGTGDVPPSATCRGANANWILDGHFFDPRPVTRDGFVAWPPPGFVPYRIVFPRWSLSYGDADFSGATVSMSEGGVPLAIVVEPIETGMGENTLVWYPAAFDPTSASAWPRPAADTTYAVAISNVLVAGKPTNFSYSVTVFDPQVAGPDTQWAAVTGPNPAALNQPNLYSISPLPRATGYQWLCGRPSALNKVESAESGLGGFTARTSPDYDLLVTVPSYAGTFYRLAHPAPTDQILTYQSLLLPGAGAQVSFRSRLTLATSGQQAKVQISPNGGLSWGDVYSQTGTNDVDGVGEIAFVNRTVSLASFAGRPILLRFNYQVDPDRAYYVNTDVGVGWHFDNVKFTDTQELRNPVTAPANADLTFSFGPLETGDYVLCARAQYFNRYDSEWGAVSEVHAKSLPTPTLEISGPPRLEGGQTIVEFQVTNYRSTLVFDLMRATNPGGPWQAESQAALEVVSANTRFRLSGPSTAAGPVFLRVRAR